MKRRRIVALVLGLSLLASCSPPTVDNPSPPPSESTEVTPTPSPSPSPSETPTPSPSETATPVPSEESDEPDFPLQPFDEIKDACLEAYYKKESFVVKAGQFTPEDIPTYSFFDNAVFEGAEDIAAEVVENGKNPGLGVRALHDQGITGEGVTVAIIDQNLPQPSTHEEYADRMVEYYDSGCCDNGAGKEDGSMHGPAVLSVLAGKTTGVAPGAKVYFCAAPSWTADASYYADCLWWIIRKNRELPEGEKIRLVSVSAAPQEGVYTNSHLWDKAVIAAQNAGILVMDCRSAADSGFVFAAHYDPDDPENVEKCVPGYPEGFGFYDDYSSEGYKNTIFAPACYRTTAQEFLSGRPFYQYDLSGGQSWSVPYAAGVLALGWQVAPGLDAQTMKDLLFQSCWINEDGNHMINPAAFIDLCKEAA